MKISFIVAIYNVEEYLRKCLDSLCNQKCDNIEIILVNDGSTDNSGEVCDIYARRDNRIKVIHQINQGVSVARNCGMTAASGEWICFVDGDDWIDTNMFEKLIPCLTKQYDVLFFQYNQSGGWEKHYKSISTETLMDMSQKEIEVLRNALLNPDVEDVAEFKGMGFNYQAPWGKLYRKEFLTQNRLLFVKGVNRGQDLLFNYSVYGVAKKAAKFTCMGYYYRIRLNSIGHGYNPDIFEINLNLIRVLGKQVTTENNNILQQSFSLMVIRQFMYSVILDCFHLENKSKYDERKKKFMQYRLLPEFDKRFKEANLKKLKGSVGFICFLAKYKFVFIMNIILKLKMILDNRNGRS